MADGRDTLESRGDIKQEMKEWALRAWRQRVTSLARPSGKSLRTAIIPIFNEWMRRTSGVLTFEMTQIITGHGSMYHYLWRFKRRESPSCIYCDAECDDNIHVACDRWKEERLILREKLGIRALTIHNILKSIVNSIKNWLAFAEFCNKVIRQKIRDENQ